MTNGHRSPYEVEAPVEVLVAAVESILTALTRQVLLPLAHSLLEQVYAYLIDILAGVRSAFA